MKTFVFRNVSKRSEPPEEGRRFWRWRSEQVWHVPRTRVWLRRLELVEGKFQFTAIMLKPTIKLSANADAAKAKELIEKAEANCLISNSMKVKVSLEATIR